MKTLTGKDLINTYIMNDNGKLLKLYMETCASVGLHVFHDGNEAFDAEFYRSGLFIACNEYSDPSSEGVLQLFMTDEDLGYELTWEELAKMNIDNLAIQTPEEKEALDAVDFSRACEIGRSKLKSNPVIQLSIDEIDKFSGEAEWNNGDDVEAYGKPYKYVGLDPFNDNLCICLANQDDDPQCFSVDEIKKPESPQQREERERLEAAYDLYCVWVGNRAGYHAIDFDKWKVEPDFLNKWLRIVDKTNYRKESN